MNTAELDRYHAVPKPIGGGWAGREIDPAQFAEDPAVSAWFDVPYANQTFTQALDVIVPTHLPAGLEGSSGASGAAIGAASDEANGPFPVIFYIPGGGWVSGDKRAATMTGIYQAPRYGFALAAVNYRYATEALWPAQIFDVKAALRFVKAHACEFNIDPERVVVWGNSAGGHLANMLAATHDTQILEDKYLGNPEQDCRVQGLISWYAITDLLEQDRADQLGGKMHPLDPPHPQHAGPETPDYDREGKLDIQARVVGFVPRHLPQATAMASPICFVQNGFPPALYQHGMDDSCVPWTQSVAMARHVNDVCGEGRASFELFEGGHGAALIKADENLRRCFAFARSAVGLPDTQPTAMPGASNLRIR